MSDLLKLYPRGENAQGKPMWTMKEKLTEVARVVEDGPGKGFSLFWMGRYELIYRNHHFDTIDETIEWAEAMLRDARSKEKPNKNKPLRVSEKSKRFVR